MATMRIVLTTLGLLTIVLGSGADARSVKVRAHVTKQGEVVQVHERTEPDRSKLNNWSTKGNTNPTTGKAGTKQPNGGGDRRQRPKHLRGAAASSRET